MKRREFITAFSGAAVIWSLAARAQQPGRLPTIGLLGAGTPLTMSHRVTAFVQRLGELGWIEGRTVAIENRWAEGRSERFAEISAEFVRINVDVIVTTGSATLAAKQATSVIPIVFALAADPVGAGYVASLARPGGNVTGLSVQSADVAGKRLELLREIVPGLRRLAIMANVDDPGAVLELREAQVAARTFGLDVATLEIRRTEDIAPALQSLGGKTEAVYVVGDPLVSTPRYSSVHREAETVGCEVRRHWFARGEPGESGCAAQAGDVLRRRARRGHATTGRSTDRRGSQRVASSPSDDVVFERMKTLDGISCAAFSQVVVDLLTSPGRGPAEGEALLDWMAKHEDDWRR